MKNIFFLTFALVLVSCGPSTEEMKKMQQEATATFDSLSKAAEEKLAKDLQQKDSLR